MATHPNKTLVRSFVQILTRNNGAELRVPEWAQSHNSRAQTHARAAEDTSHAHALCTWQKRMAVISEGEGDGDWRVEM